MKSNRLVVLSLPFQRLIRSHFSPTVLDVLKKRADVMVVCPFADTPEFQQLCRGLGVKAIQCVTESDLSAIGRKLLAVSSIMRVSGYWYRLRKDIPFYWKTRHVSSDSEDGDSRAGMLIRVVKDVLAFLGSYQALWRWVDRIQGLVTYQFPTLANISEQYQQVILVQPASWGLQDAVLGHYAGKKGWRTVFLPYTTDQLWCNGWLYARYDAICAQGDSEVNFATSFHLALEETVEKLGSLNAYLLRTLGRAIPEPVPENIVHILFAGSSALYFPLESELECLEYLLDSIESGDLPALHITYRPLGDYGSSRKVIEQRLGARKGLSINYASPAVYGLDKYTHGHWEDIQRSHISEIRGYDLLITAGSTSLTLDLAIFGTASLSYFGDPTGILSKRSYRHKFDKDGRIIGFSCIPVAHTLDSLISQVNDLLARPERRAEIVEETLRHWDFPGEGLVDRFERAVFSEVKS